MWWFKWLALFVVVAVAASACSGSETATQSIQEQAGDTSADNAIESGQRAVTVDAQLLECTMVPTDELIATAISRAAICATALLTDEQKQCAGERAESFASLPIPEPDRRSSTPEIVIEPVELADAVPLGLLEDVANVPSVARALPSIISFNPIVVDGDGAPTRAADGSPVFGRNWESIIDGEMQDGALPPGPGEFALSPAAVQGAVFEVGENYQLFTVSGAQEEFTYVGTFASDFDDLVQVVLSTEDAIRVLLGGQGLSSISVWLETSDDVASVQVALEELVSEQGLRVTVLEDAQRQEIESSTGVLRNSLAVLACLPDELRANFVGRQLGAGATVAQADCLLNFQALDPIQESFSLEASAC